MPDALHEDDGEECPQGSQPSPRHHQLNGSNKEGPKIHQSIRCLTSSSRLFAFAALESFAVATTTDICTSASLRRACNEESQLSRLNTELFFANALYVNDGVLWVANLMMEAVVLGKFAAFSVGTQNGTVRVKASRSACCCTLRRLPAELGVAGVAGMRRFDGVPAVPASSTATGEPGA